MSRIEEGGLMGGGRKGRGGRGVGGSAGCGFYAGFMCCTFQLWIGYGVVHHGLWEFTTSHYYCSCHLH